MKRVISVLASLMLIATVVAVRSVKATTSGTAHDVARTR
jgi:hypothetical protein